jgi:hypothetical protein
MCKGYYSPKIKENYIPVLYLIAKEQKMPMTKLVNQMIENEVNLLIERRQRGKGGDHYGGLTDTSDRGQNQT